MKDFLDFQVAYYQLTLGQIRRFKALLARNPQERFVQEFLERNKEIVAAHLGVHAVYVVPKPRFGTHYAADFGIAEYNSAGLFWSLVELERPSDKPFRKNGNPTAKLTHAIEQVKQWRRFIQANPDYCRRSQRENGLGLQDISGRPRGVVVMGRRLHYADEPHNWRKQLIEESQIHLMSYDRFLEWPMHVAKRNTRSAKIKTKTINGVTFLDLT